MSKQRMRLAVGLVVALFAVTGAPTQDYTLDWWTIDGGGEMWTAGGDYELSGTIGQPDAGATMTGGDFELTGGFWAPSAPGPTPVTPSAVEPGGPAEPKEPEPAP